MFLSINKQIWMLVLIAAMLALQISVQRWEMSVFPPVMIGIAAVWLFRQEILAFDFNTVKKRSYWNEVYNALVLGLILQAAGILIVKYGIGAQPLTGDFAVSLAMPIVVVIFASPVEELIFRKIIFTFLDRRIGFWAGAAVSSCLFAAVHHNYSAFLGNAALGMVWCRAYKKTGSLPVTIAAHMIFNFLVFIAQSFR